MKYIILAIGIGFYLTAAVMANATVVKTNVTAIVKIEIPVLNKTVKRGELITEDMLDIKIINERRLPRNAITDENQLIYKEAVKTLHRGIPLFSRNVRTPPTIHRGDIIAIAYEKPGLYLVTEGKALGDGSIGDKIQVMNFSSKKIIIGKITSHSKVKVN